MKDTCTQDNSRDFRQRYEGTIGALVKESGEKEYVWIQEVSQDSVRFSNKTGTTFESVNGHGTEFEFTQVPMGWYNTSEGPLFFARRPQRQWQRGISAGNTIIRNKQLYSVDVNLKIVQDALTYKGEFKKWPWAINKFFCIAGKTNNILYFLDVEIGVLEDDKLVVKEAHEDVLQELQDSLQRSGFALAISIEKA